MADINIHSRSDRAKTDFHSFISQQTTGTLHRIPTHTRPISNTTPDIVITSSNLLPNSHLDVLDPLGSDHIPVKFTIDFTRPNPTTPIIPRQVLRFDRANWVGYMEHIEAKLRFYTTHHRR